jgi:signal transduction histidine kinase
MGEQIVGTINFPSFRTRATAFTPADLEFITLISQQVSGFYQQDLAQKALKSANEELARSNRELDEFAYVVAHDLKAPLRAIQSLASWVLEDAADHLPEEAKGDLQKLKNRAERMSRLLQDLLEFSLAGSQKEKNEPVETSIIVSDTIALVSDHSNFSFAVEHPLPKLVVPRTPLEKIFRNLINNAIKHHDRRDGKITISAHPTNDDYIEFCIADDGPGIPEEFHEKIFKVFARLKSQDEVEGSGLGLAMVKKTVESLGGTIKVESQGRGSRFIFSVPSPK